MRNQYRTVSIPKGLADDIISLTERVGHWPSIGSFVREACITKLHLERDREAPGDEAEGSS